MTRERGRGTDGHSENIGRDKDKGWPSCDTRDRPLRSKSVRVIEILKKESLRILKRITTNRPPYAHASSPVPSVYADGTDL